MQTQFAEHGLLEFKNFFEHPWTLLCRGKGEQLHFAELVHPIDAPGLGARVACGKECAEECAESIAQNQLLQGWELTEIDKSGAISKE